MNHRIYIMPTLLFTVLVLVALACTPAAPPATSSVTSSAQTTTSPSKDQVTSRDTTDKSGQVEWDKVIVAAKAEGSVVVYAGSDLGGPLRPAIINAFKQKYGIEVSLLVGRGQDAQQRIKVERQIKKQVGDMVQLGGTSTSDFLEADLADPLEKILPELSVNRDKFIYNPIFDPQGRAVAVIEQVVGPMINTKLIKPAEEPQSWFDLLDTKWKGKILLADPRRGGGGMNSFQTLQYYKIVDESYFHKLLELEPGFWGGSTQEADNMVARGEYAMSFSASVQNAMPLLVEGAPIKFLDMREGLSIQTSNVMLAKDRPHPNAARLLANWMISAEGQRVIHSAGSTKSVRKDVGDFTPEKGRIKVIRPLVRDYKVSETLNYYQEMAQRVFGKK